MTEFMKPFSHIYVEEGAKNHKRTARVLEKFPNAEVIEIRDYRDVFNRRNQDPVIQHKAQKLILAVKKDGFLYEGAPVCQSFGEEAFYYTSNVMNCIYDCEYCFLKGMYPSADIVIFVNLEDTFEKIETELERMISEQKISEQKISDQKISDQKISEQKISDQKKPDNLPEQKIPDKMPERKIYVSISYESDMLAIEGFTGMLSDWAAWVKDRENVLLELRTKCANRNTLSVIKDTKNIILAITLSPDGVISKYERFTPDLKSRIEMAVEAIENDIPVRLCFDPMMYIKKYRDEYCKMVDITFSRTSADKLRDVSLGSFRISKEYIKNFRRSYPDSAAAYFPYELRDGYYQYPEGVRIEMEDFLYENLKKYVPDEKIFRWK